MTRPETRHRSREQLRLLQLERLQMLLNRAYLNVDFYRERMDQVGLMPEDIGSFEDFQRFPFTTSEDLAAHYPYGLFAVPLRSVVRLKVTHAKNGRPVVVGFTKGDVRTWQSLMARLYRRLGVTDKDIVQVAFNYNLFSGAFTFNHAAEAVGATLAPSATLSATLQLQVMRDFRSTVLATTPGFALHILDTLEREGARPLGHERWRLRLLLLGPEPVPEATRRRLEAGFAVTVCSLYGVREMVEPGIAGECLDRGGFHLAEDHFLAEIVHPVSGEVLAPGQEGELVITTLGAEAYPFIRYRTGDVTTLHLTPCACGDPAARISPVVRRTDGRVILRGIPFYPEQIGEILRRVEPRPGDFRLLVHTRWGLGEHLEVLISRTDDPLRRPGARSAYLDGIRARIRRTFGFGAKIRLVDRERLPREGLHDKTIFIEH